MKHTILKLFFLLIVMSVLISSREHAGINNANGNLNEEHSCLQPLNGLANNIACTQTTVVPEKNNVTHIEQAVDNELPLSPISRFILLQ